MTPVDYHEAAEQESLEEIAYLEVRVAGLGRRFFSEVKRAEGLISRFPELAAEISPAIRSHPLRTFRHSLVYALQNGRIMVLAVARHSRRPRYWIGRKSGARD